MLNQVICELSGLVGSRSLAGCFADVPLLVKEKEQEASEAAEEDFVSHILSPELISILSKQRRVLQTFRRGNQEGLCFGEFGSLEFEV